MNILELYIFIGIALFILCVLKLIYNWSKGDSILLGDLIAVLLIITVWPVLIIWAIINIVFSASVTNITLIKGKTNV